LKERRDDKAEEGTSPVNPISYAMLPSALNNPKFLSEVGPNFKFSLNKTKQKYKPSQKSTPRIPNTSIFITTPLHPGVHLKASSITTPTQNIHFSSARKHIHIIKQDHHIVLKKT